MSIPESQLETWSHQGSITQSSDTYNAIKKTLEWDGTPYAGKDFNVFLQGSYGNDTNIYAESDVDIVIQLNETFRHDLSAMPGDQQQAFQVAYANATYSPADFKADVLKVLTDKYGSSVKAGDKAIAIAANGSRRKADVIVAVQFRRYYKFNGIYDQRYDEGICFFDASGRQIVNYPKQHSTNLTAKHQDTGQWLKPMVRVLKNLRGALVEREIIAGGVAPSYYLEGLLYNVPNSQFNGTYVDSLVNCINWIQEADRSQFVCANCQYYLLREGSPVTWRVAQCDQFLGGVTKLWNEW